MSHSVQHLGFATIEAFPGHTRIRFQPALFPTACLQRVVEIILTRPPQRLVLERIGSLFAPLEVFQNRNDAIARLRTLQTATPADTRSSVAPTIIPLSLHRLGASRRAGLQTALTAWKKANRHATTRNVTSIATDPVFGGGGLTRMPGGDRCLVEAWPQTYERHSGVSYERFLGRDIRDLPDADYMIPTTRSYFTAAASQEPRLELIEALMTGTDGARFWCRYERLVLPWRAGASDTFVSSVPLIRLLRRV